MEAWIPSSLPLLSALVAADSVNPSLVPGGAGEDEVVGVIERWAGAQGLELERLDATPGRAGRARRASSRSRTSGTRRPPAR